MSQHLDNWTTHFVSITKPFVFVIEAVSGSSKIKQTSSITKQNIQLLRQIECLDNQTNEIFGYQVCLDNQLSVIEVLLYML